MNWSFRFARVAGIDLKIHFTFVFFLAWIAFNYYMVGGKSAAGQGVLFIVLLFLCVLLHELGHALMARRFGIRTPDITLLPIGGVARLERIPDKPKQELLIAVAGPLVNVVIAALLILFLKQRAAASDLVAINSPRVAMLAKLASVNIFLVLFNIIPAFPMDGGRILRAILAMRLNYTRATQIAAGIGQGLALLFVVLGLFYNPILMFIGLFVYVGAKQEASLVQIKELSAGISVSEAMITDFKALAPTARISEAAEALLRTSHHDFPVVDDRGHVLGLVLREDILRAMQQRGGDTLVNDAMRRDFAVVRSDERLDEAFNKMQAFGSPTLPVVDESGRLAGLLTAENVGEMARFKSLQTNHGKRRWRPAHA